MIWDTTVEISAIIQAVREDLPASPGPIVNAIAARVIREFCEKTFCLVQEIDGEEPLPDGLEPDVEFVEAIVADGNILTEEAVPVPWIPTLEAPTYPALLMEWDEYIKAGILAELQTQPGQPWSDPEAALINHRIFMQGMGRAKAQWFRLYGVTRGEPIC